MNETKPIIEYYNEYQYRIADIDNYPEWVGYQNIINKIEVMMKRGIQNTTLSDVLKFKI